MQSGQRFQREDVLKQHRLQCEAVVMLLSTEDLGQGQAQRKFAELLFDLHLPHAREAQVQGVCRGFARGQRRRRQPRIAAVPPDERVRVQQQLHASRPSQNSSGSGASKSAATSHAPA